MRIVIDDKDYKFFTKYSVELNFSKVGSTFQFSGTKPILTNQLTYPKVQIFRTNEEDNSEELILTGVLLNQPRTMSAKPSEYSFNGYSLTGVLEDCSLSVDSTQFNKLSIKEIIEKVLSPFSLLLSYTDNVSEDINKSTEEVNANLTDTCKTFINSLVSQKNIILSHNNKGELLLTRKDLEEQTPAYTFVEGEKGFLSATLTINGQEMHSQIKVLREASSNPDAAEFTIKNPYIVNSFRPLSKIQTSGDVFDVQKSARMELNKELARIRVTIESLIFVNSGETIIVNSPTLGVDGYAVFLVETCKINGSISSETYTLNCALSDAYSSDSEIINIFEA